MITPRDAHLVRVATPQAFREAIAELACAGSIFDVRDRIIVVPTRAAAMHLVRTVEDSRVAAGQAVTLPELVTRGELLATLADRLPPGPHLLTEAEREVLLGVAARAVAAAGTLPPFSLRPGLIAEMLRFYDDLRRHRNTVADFERRALERLEPGADYDRGAARLVRQTRFLASAFRDYETRVAQLGLDEHTLRDRVLRDPASRPWRHIVVTVTDRAFDRYGLYPVDWDVLARVPGLTRLDVVVTDTVLAGALHERMHDVLPGVVETRFAAVAPHDPAQDMGPPLSEPSHAVPDVGRDLSGPPFDPARAPTLLIPPSPPAVRAGSAAALAHTLRDREEEVAFFARRVKQQARTTPARLDRMALVVQQPLPYVYLAREVLRSAGVPCQMFDALPLAAEPFSAALDLVFSAVSSGFGREPVIALLRSPHFDLGDIDGERPSLRDVAALDRALAESGYLGEPGALDRLVDAWRAQSPERGVTARALRTAPLMARVIDELTPLRTARPVADHLRGLLDFLARHEQVPGPDDPLRARQLRARAAILGTLSSLEQAHRRFDAAPAEFDVVAAMTRRWIEAQTFQPLTGDAGVHVVDATSARYGSFDDVQLAGLVDGEWPERPARNIFYSPSVLRDLGWPSDADRLDGARSAFLDLLRLPHERLVLSTFSLEADAIVTPSLLVDEVERLGLSSREFVLEPTPIFDFEAMIGSPDDSDADVARGVAPPGAHPIPAYSISALERYQDCPFKFFAADVLRLDEAPEDESTLSPRARGRFIHEVFQRFFAAWDAAGHGTITTDRLEIARGLFREVAEPLLARLPEADAALERARLFGSAISVGIIDIVLGIEAARPVKVERRLLEFRLEGTFQIGVGDGRAVALKGVADRIDLLEGRRLRVIDYKSGSAPNPKRALQVPIYALCAQERLSAGDGDPWQVEEAAYVAFTGRRSLVRIVAPGGTGGALGDARARLFSILDGIADGRFPPQPHDPMICRYCAYASVCRKDYVGDD